METEPRPFGKLTRRGISELPNCPYDTFESLGWALSKPETGQPILKPVFKVGQTYLYDPEAVEEWIRAIAQWRAGAAERRRATRAAELAQVGTLTPEAEAFTARAGVNQEILHQQQEASEQHRQERADYFKSRGWKE